MQVLLIPVSFSAIFNESYFFPVSILITALNFAVALLSIPHFGQPAFILVLESIFAFQIFPHLRQCHHTFLSECGDISEANCLLLEAYSESRSSLELKRSEEHTSELQSRF